MAHNQDAVRSSRTPAISRKQTENTVDDRDNKGRFVDGNPGGPGRPKGISLVDILKRKLQEIDAETDKALAEKLMDEYIADAIERKDGVAIRDMIDRTDGKPRQDHKIEGSFEVHFDKGDEDY